MPHHADKWQLSREYLDSQGYTRSGQYFGVGAPLYSYYGLGNRLHWKTGEAGIETGHIRGPSRAAVKAELRRQFGASIKFHR